MDYCDIRGPQARDRHGPAVIDPTYLITRDRDVNRTAHGTAGGHDAGPPKEQRQAGSSNRLSKTACGAHVRATKIKNGFLKLNFVSKMETWF